MVKLDVFDDDGVPSDEFDLFMQTMRTAGPRMVRNERIVRVVCISIRVVCFSMYPSSGWHVKMCMSYYPCLTGVEFLRIAFPNQFGEIR